MLITTMQNGLTIKLDESGKQVALEMGALEYQEIDPKNEMVAEQLREMRSYGKIVFDVLLDGDKEIIDALGPGASLPKIGKALREAKPKKKAEPPKEKREAKPKKSTKKKN